MCIQFGISVDWTLAILNEPKQQAETIQENLIIKHEIHFKMHFMIPNKHHYMPKIP